MPFLGSGDLLVGSGPPRLLVIHMRLPWPLTFSSSLGDRLGNFMPPFLCKSQVGNDYLVFCLHAIEMLPAPILAAAVRRPLGGICIIGGAGCSLEDHWHPAFSQVFRGRISTIGFGRVAA